MGNLRDLSNYPFFLDKCLIDIVCKVKKLEINESLKYNK